MELLSLRSRIVSMEESGDSRRVELQECSLNLSKGWGMDCFSGYLLTGHALLDNFMIARRTQSSVTGLWPQPLSGTCQSFPEILLGGGLVLPNVFWRPVWLSDMLWQDYLLVPGDSAGG